MSYPLLLRSFVDRAEKLFPDKEIVSRGARGIFRYTYRDYTKRTRQLAESLASLGVSRGDRVATLAWNHHRHLEAYFAAPCMGAVLHTINIRLSAEHITYIINHAEDSVLLLDPDIVPLLEPLAAQLPHVRAYVIMTDAPELPETTLKPVYHYEKLLAQHPGTMVFPDDLNENSPAGMCYTSATTGNPKGVVYTHRGLYLHSMSMGLADSLALSEKDTVMPIVPMFHANAWGTPFSAVWFGTKQVLPGPAPTPQDLVTLMNTEGVTLAAGVPTVWLGISKVLEQGDITPPQLRQAVCGGSAAPRGLIKTYQEKYHIPFTHAYGMTETAPLATVALLKSHQLGLSPEEQLDMKSLQGFSVPGIELRVVGDNGDVTWNGRDMGELYIRGPWVAEEYYRDERSKEVFVDGWLRSGDIATITEEGFIHLVDRTKDLVKSGGEWISSVDLENALMAHPKIFEACVVGLPHAKWDERPVAFVVPRDPKDPPSLEEILDFLRPQFAKWWLPDDVIFIDEVPRTSVGKFMKRALREQYKSHFLQSI